MIVADGTRQHYTLSAADGYYFVVRSTDSSYKGELQCGQHTAAEMVARRRVAAD